jgi:predicted amidohydrolase
MTSAWSVGAAQTIPVKGDVERNLAEHLRLARLASEKGARVLVFPELSLTGYEIDLATGLAFEENDARLKPLIDASASFSMTLIAGAPVRVGTRLHIGAFILSPDGATRLYTKHHLGAFSKSAQRDAVVPDGAIPPAEATVFHPGDRNPLVPLDGGLAAVAVCADVGKPSHAQAAADRGARCYLASTFVIPSELENEIATLRAYAARHSMVVVFSNYGGPSGNLASAGRSSIWSPSGELLAQLGGDGPGVAVAMEDGGGWRTATVVPDGWAS